VPVVLPAAPAAAVVLGAAMLGRFAAEVAALGAARARALGDAEQRARLWDIMVCVHAHAVRAG